MTHICFIGDSHLAALKLGWPAAQSDFAGMRATFFVSPAKGMADIDVSGSALVPLNTQLREQLETTSGGEARIADGFDHYVVHGLELSASFAMEVGRKYRGEHHTRDWRAPISDDCYVQAVMGLVRTTIAVETMAKLRRITDAPITLSPTPIATARNQKIREILHKNGDSRDVGALFARACGEIAGEMRGRFLAQPAETLAADGIATKPAYSVAPARFRVEPTADDRSHMNADYGTAVLKELRAAIGHACAGQS